MHIVTQHSLYQINLMRACQTAKSLTPEKKNNIKVTEQQVIN